jgi:NitT/TauT family transport system substrate-binding protein
MAGIIDEEFKMKRVSITAAVAAWLLCSSHIAQAETDKVNFVLDWIIYGRATPYFVALEKRFFSARNIEPKIERGYGSAAGLKRLGAGQADFLFADFGGLVLARANEGLKAKMIGVVYAKNGHAVHYLENAGIKRPSDFVGKRVAGAPGATVTALFPAFLRANGVDPATVRVVSVDAQALNPVLLARQFDGMLEFNFNNALLVKEGSKMGVKPTLMMYADHNFRFYANGIITTDEIIEKKPDLARRFVAAVLEGVRYAFDHPDESCTLLRKHAASVDQDVCLTELALVKDLALTDEAKANGIGFMSKAGVQNTIDVLKEHMGLKAAIVPEETFDMSFLPKAGTAK